MPTDRAPSGTHPADATLLFLGDVVTPADVTALVAELAGDPDTADSPTYGPTIINAAWNHLSSCSSCSARRVALLGRVAVLLADDTDPSSQSNSAGATDTRVTTAVRELVPSPSAVPPPMSLASNRGGLLNGLRRRNGVGGGSGGSSGVGSDGGVLAGRRPWVIGAALVLSAVAATIVFRPRTSQTDAIAPATTKVTNRAVSAAASDAATATAAETAAAALEATSAAESDNSRANPTATMPPFAGDAMAAAPAPPIITAPSSAAMVAPVITPPSSATLTRSKKVVPPNEPVPTAAPIPAGSASVMGNASAAAAADKPTPGTDSDLGPFTLATDILDRFAVVVGPTPLPTTVDLAPAAAAPAAPARVVAPAAAFEAPACPQPIPSARASATLGGLRVVVVRLIDATGIHDVVLDARTCVEIARRPSPAPPG